MGFHFGNKVEMPRIIAEIPGEKLVFGNIDPARTLKNGTVEDVTAAVQSLLAKTAHCRNFVISSGCDVPPNTPPGNIEAFYAAVAAHNAVAMVA